MTRVDVCICTFRRPSIVEAIETVARQDVRGEIDLRIVVADNDETPSAQAAVEEAGRRFAMPLTYVHAPARNISIARNACLDAASGEWVAFIDDDEAAPADWLRRLMQGHEEADILFGVSAALIDKPGAPRWLADGSFHSNRIEGNDGLHNGYTCNVLMRRAFIERAGLRFLRELGRTGGEDTMFFDDARRAGARFAYSPQAVVYEEIPASRVTIAWLLRRRFRSGQTHHHLQARNGSLRRGAALKAAGKVAFCIASAGLAIASPPRRARALLRGALHAGFISAALGKATYQEYS